MTRNKPVGSPESVTPSQGMASCSNAARDVTGLVTCFQVREWAL